MAQSTKIRQRNLEELRCLAMMMVVVLHFLGKGDLLGNTADRTMSSVQTAAWLLEALCIVAVNCYMLISGYFLCESSFKWSRVVKLYLQVWLYSVGVGLAAAFSGVVPAQECDVHYFLTLFFPMAMGHYWFMTAYLFFCLLLPFVSMAVKRMEKQKLKLVLIIALLICSLEKTVLPFRLEEDRQGYDFLWYLCVFLVAAYMRKYGLPFCRKAWQCAVLYVGDCGLLLGELFAIRMVYLQTGSLGLIMKVSFEYNHLLVLLASVGLFGLFLHGKGEGPAGKLAARIAPYTLGVYLLHENVGVRYWWQQFFHAQTIGSVPELILWTCTAAVGVFVLGIAVEWLRSGICGAIAGILAKTGLGRKWIAFLAKADGIMEEK